MSDSGFLDDEPRQEGLVLEPPSRQARRRSGLVVAVFAVLVLALTAFATWAWSSRAHADDVDAFEVMRTEINVMDRSLTPQRHSEIPPCRDRLDGTVTRTYPDPQGPGVDDLVTYLKGTGWAEVASPSPTTVTLTRTEDGHGQSVTIINDTPSAVAASLSLSATSTGSGIGCLLR